VKVLDTSIAIDHLRGKGAAVDLLDRLLGSEAEILASEVVRYELLGGARKDELETLKQFFSAITWVPVGAEVASAAAGLARRHRQAHSGIGPLDYMIAATTLLLEAELLTKNVRHFPMFPGLEPPY
jgi:predicted nucleic acid-binding protein